MWCVNSANGPKIVTSEYCKFANLYDQWFTSKCFDIGLQVKRGYVLPPPKLLGV